MKIFVAPDSFKGSISARQFCDIAIRAVKEVDSSIEVDVMPLADGGEGTVDAFIYNGKGEYQKVTAKDPVGKDIETSYGRVGTTAIIEMAAISGLPLLQEEERNPLYTNTFGTGELIMHAIENGCKEIILGIGGSATNDGGAGMLRAFGAKLYDEKGEELQGNGIDLLKLQQIDLSLVDHRLYDVSFQIACDVTNPLTGKNGATAIYGSQKGADDKGLCLLEKGMKNYVNIIEKITNTTWNSLEGIGAAGGMALPLVAFFGGKLCKGFELIQNSFQIDKRVEEGGYQLILTGEGQINYQTQNGKLPFGMAKIGKKYNIPVVAIAGAVEKDIDPLYEHGLTAAFSITNKPMLLSQAIEEAEDLLAETLKNIIKLIQI